jgi:hypothetical protein
MQDGEVRFRSIDGVETHDAINVGEATWRNIVVELKEQTASGQDRVQEV